MLCEQCGKELETTTCSECGTVVLKLGRFCYSCGSRLDQRESTWGEAEENDVDFLIADIVQ